MKLFADITEKRLELRRPEYAAAKRELQRLRARRARRTELLSRAHRELERSPADRAEGLYDSGSIDVRRRNELLTEAYVLDVMARSQDRLLRRDSGAVAGQECRVAMLRLSAATSVPVPGELRRAIRLVWRETFARRSRPGR